MIPAPDVALTPEESARWKLTCLVAALVREGVHPAIVLADCQEGVDLATGKRQPKPDTPRLRLVPTEEPNP